MFDTDDKKPKKPENSATPGDAKVFKLKDKENNRVAVGKPVLFNAQGQLQVDQKAMDAHKARMDHIQQFINDSGIEFDDGLPGLGVVVSKLGLAVMMQLDGGFKMQDETGKKIELLKEGFDLLQKTVKETMENLKGIVQEAASVETRDVGDKVQAVIVEEHDRVSKLADLMKAEGELQGSLANDSRKRFEALEKRVNGLESSGCNCDLCKIARDEMEGF
ncbi:hypothetical protein KAR91_23760 [Candidatus Pacearchaeota archaeon]|nr:hypothetical protein [Candidatus Pacearchaeota archaeon]